MVTITQFLTNVQWFIVGSIFLGFILGVISLVKKRG